MRNRVMVRAAAVFLSGITLSVAGSDSPAQEGGSKSTSPGSSPELAALVAAHNEQRTQAKLPPLAANPKLVAAAIAHARDMAEHEMMSHEGSDGSKPNERIERQDYHGRRTGENVAMGQKDVAQVMQAWMNSPHHRENILGDFSEIGAARVASDDGTPYWCVNFGLGWPQLNRDEATSQLVGALNRARQEAGKPAFKVNRKLGDAAQTLAQDLASRGDLGAGGAGKMASPDKRVEQAGYRFSRLGEAAATGQPSGDEVAKTWLGSPAHRDNFLGKFSEIGVGYATNARGIPFWAVFLAEPASR